MSVEPGWYVDPVDREIRRYWDGDGWVGAPIPVAATPPPGPPPEEPPTPPASAAGPTSGAPPRPAPPSPGQAAGPDQAAGPSPTAGPGQAGPGQAGPGQAGWPAPNHPHPGQPYPGQHYPVSGPPPGWPAGTWPGRPPEPRPHGLPLAGYGARLVARLVDFAIVFALNAVVNGWFVWRLAREFEPTFAEWWRRVQAGEVTNDPLPPPGQEAEGLLIVILLIAAALWMAYEVPAMASSGQTLGKRLLGIRAVSLATDEPLGFGRSLRRWNTLGLPTLLWPCFCLGFALQLLDALSPLFDHPMRQALHDKRAQTVVVHDPRPRATSKDRADSKDSITPKDPADPKDSTASKDRSDPPGDIR